MGGKLGKIDHGLVERLIGKSSGHPRQEVRTGPKFGVDVSVVNLPGGLALAMTSDPLSLIPSLGLQESAWLSVHLMANDMATTGHAPMYGQFVLNLPASFSESDFAAYWQHIHRFCDEIGVAITGGHTGFIEGQNSTIAGGGTFVTVAPLDGLLVSSQAQHGDALLVTKTCAISSSAILAMSFPHTVRNKAGMENYHRACESFYHTSSLPDALAAVAGSAGSAGVTAMHDVTEGGVLGAIYELATASGNGARIESKLLPLGDVQTAICHVFDLDPRHCVGAGSMIIACKKDAAETIISRLAQKAIPCVQVGELCEPSQGVKLIREGVEEDLPYMEVDPYWAAFFNAHKQGWK